MIIRVQDDYFSRCVFPTGIAHLDHATGCGGLPRAALTSLYCSDAPAAYALAMTLVRQADALGHTTAVILPEDRRMVAAPSLRSSGTTGAVLVKGDDDCLEKIRILLRRRFDLIVFEPPLSPVSGSCRETWKKVMQQVFGSSSLLLGLCTESHAPANSAMYRRMANWSRMIMTVKARRDDRGRPCDALVRITHRGLVPYSSQVTLPGTMF